MFLESNEYTVDTALDAYWYFSDEGDIEVSDQDNMSYFLQNMPKITTVLACLLPDLFVPYFFQWNFNVLDAIAKEFDISLSEIPLKRNYQERVYYYGSVCESLTDFREENGLSPAELCAFLYDYAPKVIGGYESYICPLEKLPQAKAAYLIGSAEDDIFLKDDPSYITPWQCKTTKLVGDELGAGDYIVMYLTAPVSAVGSIWRSVSNSFDDPFFYYYRCTYISGQTKVRQLSLDDMRKDKVLGQLPIVKKNMQGVNGTELSPAVFNRLVDKCKMDVEKFAGYIPVVDEDIHNEKDVEHLLIAPLLHKMGYIKCDCVGGYIQQLHLPLGNHNTSEIPDFVLNHEKRSGHDFATAIVEAKHSVVKEKNLEDARDQVRGYALHLNASSVAVAAQEGIWLYSSLDDFGQPIFSCTWQALAEPDNYQKVARHLGIEDNG